MAAKEEKPRWCYEKDNKWIDYDEATITQLEDNLSTGLNHKQKLMLIVKLKHGPMFGTEENKEKYMVRIQLDGTHTPPNIWKCAQFNSRNKKEMINVTRFPVMDTDNTAGEVKEIMDYECKCKWFWRSENDEDDEDDDDDDDNGWKQYDIVSSKQIELTLNKKKKFVILNKSNYFKSAIYKNLYRVEFNHHSIPSEATQIEYIAWKQKNKTEVKYDEIDTKTEDNDNQMKDGMDEVMSMIMLTKHYMRPLSMKYWMQKRVILNDRLQCRICIGEFEEEHFLEYWVSRKLMKKHKEEPEEGISAKEIAIQLSLCKGEHFFHTECIAEWFLRKKKCPLCQQKYGITIGHQPKGKMTVSFDKDRDVGGAENKGKGLIEIVHRFPHGVQGPFHQHPGQRYSSDVRYIYLPNTAKGKEILELTKIGWKRKVLYTVGHSVTRSTNNSVVWNGVHFKTNQYGGVQNWGWPDKTYCDRVKDEFKQKGITVDDIPRHTTKKH